MNEDSKLLAEAYDLVNSKKRLLSRIKPEFQKLYIKDLEHFNGSYKDHTDFLNKAQEMGHLNEDENSISPTDGTPGDKGKEQIIKNFYKNIEQTIQELTDLNISGRMNEKDAHFRATREIQQAFKKFVMNPYLPNEIGKISE